MIVTFHFPSKCRTMTPNGSRKQTYFWLFVMPVFNIETKFFETCSRLFLSIQMSYDDAKFTKNGAKNELTSNCWIADGVAFDYKKSIVTSYTNHITNRKSITVRIFSELWTNVECIYYFSMHQENLSKKDLQPITNAY